VEDSTKKPVKVLTSNAVELRYSSNFHWGYVSHGPGHKEVLESRKKASGVLPIEQEPMLDSSGTDKQLSLLKMNLNIPKGAFVCIIGDVGSGKSSLLSAIIGDMLYLSEE